ncbi:hypothetical protein NW752_003292 [Fusarium irregulare]|nr:hypothetical protein NW752_003292 [Fusarium irregulare]
MVTDHQVKYVAVIGAGASGTAAAAALKAEGCFNKIKVFERRGAPGGLWLYDNEDATESDIKPGALPPALDPPSRIPHSLPRQQARDGKHSHHSTPMYESLMYVICTGIVRGTTVPEIAMSFSDKRFPYGPFVPHHVPLDYLQDYYSLHQIEHLLVLNTTVEDVSRISDGTGQDRWQLTLRQYNHAEGLDEWRQEIFDAVIIANGQHSIPYVPQVKGLEEYMERYPDSVSHSKSYRTPDPFKNKKVLIVGNSLSGRDVAGDLVKVARLPVYVSRRHRTIWDAPESDEGIEWKPVIVEFISETGQILFEDGSYLSGIDHIIYCTGYKPSFPFWNTNANGQELYDYSKSKLNGSYLHTFFKNFPTLGIIGLGKILAFRSYEYQAIALARVFAGRNAIDLPSQEEWEASWENYTRTNGMEFHEVSIEDGELLRWYTQLSNIAGLPLCGKGRVPPAFTDEAIWQLRNVKRY